MHRGDMLLAWPWQGCAVREAAGDEPAEPKRMSAAAKAAGVLFGVAQNFRTTQSGVDAGADCRGAHGNELAHAQYLPGEDGARKWIANRA